MESGKAGSSLGATRLEGSGSLSWVTFGTLCGGMSGADWVVAFGAIAGGEIFFIFIFFACILLCRFGRGCSYHLSAGDGGGMGSSSISSGMDSMGVLLCVFHWWIFLMALTTRLAVVLVDIYGTFTLWGWHWSTLWGGPSLRISVSCCIIFACFTFCRVLPDNPWSTSFANSAATINVLLSAEMVGIS